MISFGRLKKMFDYPSLDKQDENDFRSAHIRSSTSPARLITIITYIQTHLYTFYNTLFFKIHNNPQIPGSFLLLVGLKSDS